MAIWYEVHAWLSAPKATVITRIFSTAGKGTICRPFVQPRKHEVQTGGEKEPLFTEWASFPRAALGD